jgi:hypothetical protein
MTSNVFVFFSAVGAIAELVVIVLGGFKMYLKLEKKLNRIEYALFNDGKNGAVQQIAELYDNQQVILTDIEVMKVKLEQKPRQRKTA